MMFSNLPLFIATLRSTFLNWNYNELNVVIVALQII